MNNLLKSVMHLFVPVSCPMCGCAGEALCPDCAAELLSYHEHEYNNLRVYAAAIYGGDIKRVIINLKYKELKAAGRILGAQMAEIFERPDVDLLVPVPLHAGSDRCYNQSLAIARGLSSKWHIKAADICRWSRIIAHRMGLNKSERESLTPDAFKISAFKNLKNLKIALVDDVCTTGSTLRCLAAALEKSGASVRSAYVVAKT